MSTGGVRGKNPFRKARWNVMDVFNGRPDDALIGFPVIATGGTVTDITQDGANYRVHTFTSDGTFEVTRGGEVEYLVVAGGGGGGGGRGAGGGGAGGMIEFMDPALLTIEKGSYNVVVGDGGQGGDGDGDPGVNGQDSSFGEFVAFGGGGGGAARGGNGLDGGSGGGLGYRAQELVSLSGPEINVGFGFPRQGNSGGGRSEQTDTSSGGRCGGGGGGAGRSPRHMYGRNGPASYGGTGLSNSITGVETFYAGGGGGGGDNVISSATNPEAEERGNFSPGPALGGFGGGGTGGTDASTPATSGEANTGGGGGGAGRVELGGAGGSGIVIVRYRI